MGSYTLYKCRLEYVDLLYDIPEPVKVFLEDRGYIQDEETVKQELSELDDLSHNEEIMAYLKKHDLFDFDLKWEYD